MPLQLQLKFPGTEISLETRNKTLNSNKLHPNDRAFHDWYRFVLSFPPHLVRDYIKEFKLGKNQFILDPFCGTGTTLVESKLNGIPAIGIEASPFAYFASSVKIDWTIDPEILLSAAKKVAKETFEILKREGLNDRVPFQGNPSEIPLETLDKDARKLLITNSISPIPLHKTLRLLEVLKAHQNSDYFDHAILALANALVFKISNLKFGPEVGVGKAKSDFPVVPSWMNEIKKFVKDLNQIQSKDFQYSQAKLGDSRETSRIIEQESIDAVITSPPYPNEKDYSRTTRLESVVLGFIESLEDLRKFKKSLIRSNTRNIYKNDCDHKWIENNENVLRLADEIEKKRIELGKTSGFEKLYSQVTLQYFGGMFRHFADLRTVLKRGALLAYVVGDQASYFKIMIRTGKLLAEIAQSLGYELVGIELFRKRFATATASELREEVVILRWPG